MQGASCLRQVQRERAGGRLQGRVRGFFSWDEPLFDGSAYTLLFPVCKIVREVAARLRLGCCLSVDKPSGMC